MASKENEIKYPKNFFFASEVVSKVAGVVIPDEGTKMTKLFFLLYDSTAFIVAMTFLMVEIYYLKETVTETEKLIRHIGLLLTHTIGAAKFFTVIIFKDTIQHIKNVLQDKNYQYETVGDFQPGKIFTEEKRFTDKVIAIMSVLYYGVGFSAHISSAIDLSRLNGTFPDNQTCYDFLPYYFFIPFSADTIFSCHQALIFMDLALAFSAIYILNLDVTFISLNNALKSQFVIVGGAFTNLRERCIKAMGLPENYEIMYDIQEPQFEERLYNELTHSTKHLGKLLRAHTKIENLFTYITLAQTLVSLFVFASCLFLASKVPLDSPQFFSQIEYFMAVLTQLSVYCWFGNQITIASESISSSLYSCDWFSSSLRFKKSILINMSGMQRPIYISIGKFTPLTLATLLNVLRGSFSYFTMLKTME